MKKIKVNYLLAFFLIIFSFLFSCQNVSEVKTATNVAGKDSSHIETNSKTQNTVFPKPENWVTDNENILDDSSVAQLTRLINNLREKTAVEIGIMTTPNYAPYNSILDYSIALGNDWGIGQIEINNGILIVVSTTKREVRISTGLGMEQLITDSMCQKIVYDNILPSFKKGNYPEGIINGVKEIIRLLEAQMHEVKLN